ncbi:MAG: hypothetical protein IPP90_13460 [Gemmatimonadaceae bacterium]|nr:hypothetical protein [Gemmatimonadaceae bacterium]
MPPTLRTLLEAELDAGNAIIEVGHSHPAPPVGAYFKLARQVSTRPRESGDGLNFFDRHGSTSSGEFTDTDRRYWILEAPNPADAEELDMDAIRAALQPPPFVPEPSVNGPSAPQHALDHSGERGDPGDSASDADAWRRFADSKRMDYDRWKEGIGYDLDALASLSVESQRVVERQLTPPSGWRDVEALAALDTATARETLRGAVHAEDIEVRLAVLSHAPELIDDATRTDAILLALTEAGPFAGRTETLDLVMEFHPPVVVQAMFVRLLLATGEMAYHYAATLTAIHGVVDSRYDWSLRPMYLAFNTDEMSARREAFLSLCTTLGVDGPAQLAVVDQTIATHHDSTP